MMKPACWKGLTTIERNVKFPNRIGLVLALEETQWELLLNLSKFINIFFWISQNEVVL